MKRKKFLSIMLVSGLICFCSALLQLCSGRDSEKEAQVHLYEKLKSLSTDNVISIEIQFFKYGKMVDNKCILTKKDLNNFLSFLHDNDLMQVGGHNSTLYETIIVVNYKNKTMERFVGNAYSGYEFNKDALYIYNYSIQTHDYYLESKNGIGMPVRVPRLGQWLSTRCSF